MTNEKIKQKLSVIISDEALSGNEKRDKISELFEYEMHLNMQYYMEFCLSKGYVTPKEWIDHIKSF